ncbi:hypothetical protein [Haloferax volcanii]|uniref:Uncharacterized protein n=2 Tax=Haloferax volcanii TaxID=2246 RepID=D4GX60_HALVD|nr:hypothetical protein [Haloferax volcanii]ADE05021.1 uncharacterized protein HVO_1254 [Haloferax volcanii DS2]MBS8117694.1 hypothetical protein [Haloferax volcanii]MBS8122706.1 hypothetical protein [Haloferax volcanii]MBS8126574.1 hypothetical protein [Haloferax volcanii]MBS8130440.1 hypothetical protein [Haloferax volcanii]
MSAAVSPIAVVVPGLVFGGAGFAFLGPFGAGFGAVVGIVLGVLVGRGEEY